MIRVQKAAQYRKRTFQKQLNQQFSSVISLQDFSGSSRAGPWVDPSPLWACSGQGFGLSSAYRPHSGWEGAAEQGVSSAYGLRHPSSLGWSNRGVFCVFDTCSASIVNHAQRETSGINVFCRLFPMFKSTTHWQGIVLESNKYMVCVLCKPRALPETRLIVHWAKSACRIT